jgi:hypothetical protein
MELVDVPLAGGGTLDNPFVLMSMPRIMAEQFVWDPDTEDLVWTGTIKTSMGKSRVTQSGRLRKAEPYGVLYSVEVLDWMKEEGFCRPDQTYVMTHIAAWAIQHKRQPYLGMTIDHVEALCPYRNTLCGNPLHTEEISASENTLRMLDALKRPISLEPPMFRSEFYLKGVAPERNITVPFFPPKHVAFRSSRSRYAGVQGNRHARDLVPT